MRVLVFILLAFGITSSFAEVDFKSPNFTKCHAFYIRTYSSSEAADTCIERVKSGFDFTSEKFEACHKYYVRSQSSADAADNCITKDFDFTSSNFQNCHSYYVRTYSPSDAADVCIKHVNRGFNFLGEQFRNCHSIYVRSLSSADASNKCLTKEDSLKVKTPEKEIPRRTEVGTPYKTEPFDPPETEYKY